ncbi:DUF4209 domain-containing protein [Candidatus Acidulodesulfobacterium sp. H_13]|uniref:DUF4209 domain-containing protein n=1 Tax=Candidatus Acidulodesulfobacterium sp. H_13 TaxID=3395470 RepID=UPI003AF63C1C
MALSCVFSMMLKPENLNEPFIPRFTINRERTTLPEDFSEENIIFFESIVEICENIKLKARIADILWLLREKDRFNYLKIALSAYGKFCLAHDEISLDSAGGFERAIRLSLATKQPLEDLRAILLNNFDVAKVENKYHCIRLNYLLSISKIDKGEYANIIKKLDNFAKEFLSKDDWYVAREYFQAIHEWYKKSDDKENANKTTIEIAETFANKAQGGKDSQIATGSLYENALQEYRSISAYHKDKLQIDKRINELYQKMSYVNKLSLGDMYLVQTEGVDGSEDANKSIKAIKGKELDKAIVILSKISPDLILAKIEEKAEGILKFHPFTSMLSTSYLSSDGRVVYKRCALDVSGGESDVYMQALEAQTIQQYSIHVSFATQVNIIPACQQLIAEHRISKQYMIALCSNSFLVPIDRISAWSEGLYFGFEQNFLVSTHILIPQVENIIRILLKQIQVKTTILDSNGIETEKGLGMLLKEERLLDVLGDNLIFEFNILLSNQIGYNIRNNIAHGLRADNFRSVETIYFWWLCLKLIVKTNVLISNEAVPGDIGG